ncbi:hypothetical protein J6590_029591, partial [Homalodisca vitripennis]
KRVQYVGEVTMPTGSKVTKGAVGRSDNEASTLQSVDDKLKTFLKMFDKNSANISDIKQDQKVLASRKFCHGGTNDIKQKLEVQGEEYINRRRRHCED